MKQLQAQGIVLGRTDYGEADRIVTMLTPNNGKLKLMARGVRRQKSKLAGGIELFSVSDISYIKGRGEIDTMTSTRLLKHFGQIVKNLERVQLGYDLIKLLNRATEDEPEPEYFDLLEQTFGGLDDASVDLGLIRVWFQAQLLKLGGHTPNLRTDTTGEKLSADQNYSFDSEAMTFASQGNFSSQHIKTLRLLFTQTLNIVANVDGVAEYLSSLEPIVKNMVYTYLRT